MRALRIGSFVFDAPVFLAPMAGVTDTVFRRIAKEHGCPLAFAEMVSAQGIHYRSERTIAMLRTEREERPIAMQLFARRPELAAEAAAYTEELQTADLIDFNMGCPAPKIVKNGEGSALMKEPELAEWILRAMRRAIRMPLTVKIRLGWDETSLNAVEIAKRAEAAGVDAIAVHGRTRAQFYSGTADWEKIAEVKRAVSVPVIANGDIRTVRDLARALDVTGADGVMIGRAAQGNPWIFRRMTRYIGTGEILPEPTWKERAQEVLRHFDLLVRFKGDYIGPREMRKHAIWYTRGLPHGAQLRKELNAASVRADFERVLAPYLTGELTEESGSAVRVNPHE